MEQNYIKEQEYEYNGQLYYIPRINNVQLFIKILSDNIKSEDDLLICKACEYCPSCKAKHSLLCDVDCDTCILNNMNKNKYNVLKLFLEKNDFFIDDLKKPELEMDINELTKIHEELKDFFDAFQKFYPGTDLNGNYTHSWSIVKFKKGLITLKNIFDKINCEIKNNDNYSNVK